MLCTITTNRGNPIEKDDILRRQTKNLPGDPEFCGGRFVHEIQSESVSGIADGN